MCFDGLLFSQQRFTELALSVDITRNYSINFYIFLELAPKTLVSFLIRLVFLYSLIVSFCLCYVIYILYSSQFFSDPSAIKRSETKKNEERRRNKKIALAINTVFSCFKMLATARTILLYLKFSAIRGLETIPLNSKRLSVVNTKFLIKISEL